MSNPACISAFYCTSQDGVKIDLQVWGIGCLRPGIPGLGDTISVSTIVGRFLEHARIYYFRNGGMEEVFLGSADLMPWNLDRRAETLFPVENPVIKKAIVSTILPVQFRDNIRIRLLMRDGTYQRCIPSGHETPLEAQS